MTADNESAKFSSRVVKWQINKYENDDKDD